jgi:hypothetical protein
MRSWPIWVHRRLPHSSSTILPTDGEACRSSIPSAGSGSTSSADSRTSTSSHTCSSCPGFLCGRAWREAKAAYSCVNASRSRATRKTPLVGPRDSRVVSAPRSAFTTEAIMKARRHLSQGLNGFPDQREPAVGVLRSSRNHFSIASSLAKTLRWVDVADFLALCRRRSRRFSSDYEGQDGHSLPSQFSLLLNLSQALRQAFKLRTDLRFHGVLQCERAPAGKFCRGLSVQILLPIPDCLLSGALGLHRSLNVRLLCRRRPLSKSGILERRQHLKQAR